MSVMFEKLGQVAEKVATGVSRRRFFGRMAKWATGAAVGIAGLMTAGNALAQSSRRRCCYYYTPNASGPVFCGIRCIPAQKGCPTSVTFKTHGFCRLITDFGAVVSNCTQCPAPPY